MALFAATSADFCDGAKIFEASTPIAPALVTMNEIDDVDLLEIRLTVNRKERQRAVLADLVSDVPSLIADVSRIVRLEPGELIATGICRAAGVATETVVTDGDVVEVSLDKLSIRNTFREPSEP